MLKACVVCKMMCGVTLAIPQKSQITRMHRHPEKYQLYSVTESESSSKVNAFPLTQMFFLDYFCHILELIS